MTHATHQIGLDAAGTVEGFGARNSSRGPRQGQGMRIPSSVRAISSEEKRSELNGAEQNITEKNRAQLNPNTTQPNR
jgi:hypothetical protein